jgi:hypothetical protein
MTQTGDAVEDLAAVEQQDAGERDNHDSDQPSAPGEHVVLSETGVRDIRAASVSISQGGARDIDATTVTITQGGAGRVAAKEMTVSQGGVGMARTDRLQLERGGSAGAVIADQATVAPGANILLLVARTTSGEIRPLLDWRAAAAFAFGLVAGLRLLRRRR